MRYAQIRKMDISNGEGLGVSLFVQGCPFHCFNCFNSETWDFDGGDEWNAETQEGFLKLLDNPYIKRVSILGGEPLAEQNRESIYELLLSIKQQYPDKCIWIYSGYSYEMLMLSETYDYKALLSMCNVLVDGPYIDDEKDLKLLFKGSANQRIIDLRETITNGKIVLWSV